MSAMVPKCDRENRLIIAAINNSARATISYDYEALGPRQSESVGAAPYSPLEFRGDALLAQKCFEVASLWD
jgi:hypothetical protein